MLEGPEGFESDTLGELGEARHRFDVRDANIDGDESDLHGAGSYTRDPVCRL